ncbi:glycosyltransferase family 2 protein [Thalassococcus sp. S3]|uniref:glycosyltransferase family 2 protein n=1 Tax=Thalassococcus sp. S3 TaxID=2017482 RepID=UPI001023F68A|nr:glycosyltransferase family 2 protein [Thalassococcus sp. S3]QBF31362.1 glycosyl transferase family 2 [Thalassococcus sp. S3]
MIKWGLCATIKAPLSDVLSFVAYHLDQGAHRLYIYLDDADDETFRVLKAHPKVRPTLCDAAWWDKRGGRPVKHQVRQARNATHAYRRRAEVDWLTHIDVDEFLWPGRTVEDHLACLPDAVLCARLRPIEALAGDGTAFKAFLPAGPERDRVVDALYPTYGRYIKGGFLSHVAGKLFVRTGLPDIQWRIHNVFQGDAMNPGEKELTDVSLCHVHTKSWEDWIAAYRYRLAKGSYRSDLAPSRPREKGGRTLHELFSDIEAREGEAGLRAFFEEVCEDTADLHRRLDAYGLLRLCDLQLDAKRQRHFPEIT